jgi:rRNA maturation RNase YbeY
MSTNIKFHGKAKFLDGESRKKIRSILISHAQTNRYDISSLSYVFVDDEYLLELNQKTLNHDTYTDIITFDLSDQEGMIDGEIYISIDRVKENAKLFNVAFITEMIRVVAHGYLHLIGFKDKTSAQKEEMRKQEEYFIKQFEIV